MRLVRLQWLLSPQYQVWNLQEAHRHQLLHVEKHIKTFTLNYVCPVSDTYVLYREDLRFAHKVSLWSDPTPMVCDVHGYCRHQSRLQEPSSSESHEGLPGYVDV